MRTGSFPFDIILLLSMNMNMKSFGIAFLSMVNFCMYISWSMFVGIVVKVFVGGVVESECTLRNGRGFYFHNMCSCMYFYL